MLSALAAAGAVAAARLVQCARACVSRRASGMVASAAPAMVHIAPIQLMVEISN